jgi:23S rRNA pseudouridine955/2504/2580 synthase
MAEELTILPADDGQRLDRWLKKSFPDLPFGQMQKILRTGQVRVNGKRAKGETRLATGQEIRIPPQLTMPGPKTRGSAKDAAFIKGITVFEDAHILVLNKPAGIAVQGGSKVTRHIDGMLDALLDDDGNRPHLVHRLDRDTSGLLLLAKNAKVAAELGHTFQSRDIRKIYWAVTTSVPRPASGEIEAPVGKVSVGGGERMMATDGDEGKYALTLYQTLDTTGNAAALVAFWPRTGRTHQIRVHAAHIGCPLLGDEKYGDDAFLNAHPDLPRALHLHARRLTLAHPVTNKVLELAAPLPDTFQQTLAALGLEAGEEEVFE